MEALDKLRALEQTDSTIIAEVKLSTRRDTDPVMAPKFLMAALNKWLSKLPIEKKEELIKEWIELLKKERSSGASAEIIVDKETGLTTGIHNFGAWLYHIKGLRQ